jgi:hypothetical protein
MQNESMTVIKAEFKYPATEPMIQQCAQYCGCQINRVRVFTTSYDEEMIAQDDKIQNMAKPLLTNDYADDADAKQASKDYANQYLDKVTKDKSSIDIPYEGKKTPTATNTSKEGINTQSPMTNIKRPMRPETGSRKASA